MSCNEHADDIINDEIIETKPIKKQYKPRDPKYSTMYDHTTVAPVASDICRCSIVTRALYNHTNQVTVN